MGPIIAVIVVVVLLLILIVRNIHVVQQSKAYVIERMGAFSTVWEVGIHFKMPFVEKVAKKVSLKEQVLDYPPQPVITKDNVTMQIDTVVYFQITDPQALHLRRGVPHGGHGDPDRHHPPQHHRRPGAGPDPHQPRRHQHQDARHSGTKSPTPGASRSTAWS